jgi:hypothetical protein
LIPPVSNANASRYGGFVPHARSQWALVPHHTFEYEVGSEACLNPSTRFEGKL